VDINVRPALLEGDVHILDGNIPVLVLGYCNYGNDEKKETHYRNCDSHPSHVLFSIYGDPPVISFLVPPDLKRTVLKGN
jgi:hypothetical protein